MHSSGRRSHPVVISAPSCRAHPYEPPRRACASNALRAHTRSESDERFQKIFFYFPPIPSLHPNSPTSPLREGPQRGGALLIVSSLACCAASPHCSPMSFSTSSPSGQQFTSSQQHIIHWLSSPSKTSCTSLRGKERDPSRPSRGPPARTRRTTHSQYE